MAQWFSRGIPLMGYAPLGPAGASTATDDRLKDWMRFYFTGAKLAAEFERE